MVWWRVWFDWFDSSIAVVGQWRQALKWALKVCGTPDSTRNHRQPNLLSAEPHSNTGCCSWQYFHQLLRSLFKNIKSESVKQINDKVYDTLCMQSIKKSNSHAYHEMRYSAACQNSSKHLDLSTSWSKWKLRAALQLHTSHISLLSFLYCTLFCILPLVFLPRVY